MISDKNNINNNYLDLLNCYIHIKLSITFDYILEERALKITFKKYMTCLVSKVIEAHQRKKGVIKNNSTYQFWIFEILTGDSNISFWNNIKFIKITPQKYM